MSSTTCVRPFGNTRLAQFLDKHIDQKVNKSHREIAQAAGWSNSTMATMLEKVDSKLPLDRVIPFAKAISVEPMYLFRLALEQYVADDGELAGLISFVVTPNEAEIVNIVRAANPNDPKVDDTQRKALIAAFSS
jgi:hypothetical protein